MSAPAPKKRLDYLTQEQPRRVAGRYYSVVARFLRLALPLAAIGIIGLVMAWPQVEDIVVPIAEQSSLPQRIAKNELINPRFESRDGKNQPYTIMAQRALQSARDPSVILLEQPQAQMTLAGGAVLSGAAEQGAYRQDTEKLLLQGTVILTHSDDYRLVTEKLQLDMQAQSAWSDQDVIVTGADAILAASGMQADGARDRLIFTGPAKLVLKRSIKGIP